MTSGHSSLNLNFSNHDFPTVSNGVHLFRVYVGQYKQVQSTENNAWFMVQVTNVHVTFDDLK